MSLSDVMALRPGSQILLSSSPGSAVQLRCGAVTLFEGRIGRRKNRVAVRIDHEVAQLPRQV